MDVHCVVMRLKYYNKFLYYFVDVNRKNLKTYIFFLIKHKITIIPFK